MIHFFLKHPKTIRFVLIGFLGALFLGATAYWLYDTAQKQNEQKNTQIKALIFPTVSHKSGFYTHDIQLKLASSYPNAQLYYTTDGTEPTFYSHLYQHPLSLKQLVFEKKFEQSITSIPTSLIWKRPQSPPFRGVALRVSAYVPNKGFTPISTHTYFLTPQGRNRYKLPVLCITTNPQNLFDPIKGIFVLGKEYYQNDKMTQERLDLPEWLYYRLPGNYYNRGQEWQKDAHVDYWEMKNGAEGFKRNVKIRLKGQSTRSLPAKSLLVFFKEKELKYPLFEHASDLHSFNSILVRNGSGDWKHTMIRDEFVQTLLQTTKLERNNYQPVILFINGEYWGLYNLREHFSKQNIARKHHCDTSLVDYLEVHTDHVYTKDSTSKKEMEQLVYMSYKKDSLGEKAYYDYLAKQLDLDKFIDYIILQTYIVNTDWPNNNVWLMRVFKDKTDKGKWEFVLYDTDWGLDGSGRGSQYKRNMTEHLFFSKTFIGEIFRNLYKYPSFRQKYDARALELMQTTFSPSQMLQTFEAMQERIAPFMVEQTLRWGYPKDTSEWKKELDTVRLFIRERPLFYKKQF